MLTTIQRFLAPPTFAGDEEKTQTAFLLNIILIASAILLAGLLLSQIAAGFTTIASAPFQILLILFLMCLGLIYLMHQGYANAASFILVSVGWVALIYLAWGATGVYDTAYLGTLLLIFMASLLLGWQAGLVLTVLTILAGWALAFLQSSAIVGVTTVSPPYSVALDLTVIFILAAVLFSVSVSYLRQALTTSQKAIGQLQGVQLNLEAQLAESNRDLGLVAEVGHLLGNIHDREQLLTQATETIRTHLNLYYAQIFLLDADQKSLLLQAGTGSTGHELQSRGHRLQFNSSSINGSAAVRREPVLVSNTTTSSLFQHNPLFPETRSELAFPLLVGDKVVGVLDLQSAAVNGLSTDNLPAIGIIASQLAVAIENGRLIQAAESVRTDLQQRIRQDTREDWDHYLDAIQRGERIGYRYEAGNINELARQAEEVADQDRLVNVPIDIAGEMIGAVQVEGATPENDRLSDEDLELVTTVTNQIKQQLENLRLLDEADRYRQEANAASNRLVREGWQDLTSEQETTAFVYEEGEVMSLPSAAGDWGDSLIRAPLMVQDEAIGQLEVSGAEVDGPQADTLLVAVAQRLSAHIENLRLNEQTERALAEARQRSAELNILNDMGITFTSATDATDILGNIHKYTNQLIPQAANLTVVLTDQATGEVTLHEFFKPGQETPEGKVQSVITRPRYNQISDYILETRHPLLINGDMTAVAAQLRFAPDENEPKSWMGVPMVVGERTIGAIILQHETAVNTYNQHHLDLLTAVASSAAISLESVRLLEQVRSRARQEQILREVTASVHAAVDADAILRTAAQEINRQLGLDTLIYLEDQPETTAPATNGGNGRG